MMVTGISVPDRKNLILLFYVSAFAIINFVLYSFSHENWVFLGVIELLILFLFPFGAFIYGYVTRDRLRSFFAGTLSYVSFILVAMLTSDVQSLFEMNYLFLFVGYHLTLLLIIGLIGFFASKKETSFRVIGFILSVLWILIFLSGVR